LAVSAAAIELVVTGTIAKAPTRASGGSSFRVSFMAFIQAVLA
jgi:hypothetical protein